MPNVHLLPHQQAVLEKLHSGSIVYGGVGSGKSITSLAYFFVKECKGGILPNGNLSDPKAPMPLYIITTARKRDDKEWELECTRFLLSTDPLLSRYGISVVVDSWNNIGKYKDVHNAFFIFDEQRVVGSGSWVRAFIRIAKSNRWILLSATPGDGWMDYIPVFVANGFYKNRSEFLRRHAVYNRYSKFPKVDRFLETAHLERLRQLILVPMEYGSPAKRHYADLPCAYDPLYLDIITKKRWDPYKDEPIRDIAQACYLMRRVVNSHPCRLELAKELLEKFPKLIIFYNFDYELDILRSLSEVTTVAEWNGHRHEPVPETDSWAYLVQYTAGAEGWNCIRTNAILFYSQNYSYKLMTQAAGRIDRMNTPYKDLYYYTIRSHAPIDISIARALKGKRNFNERAFLGSGWTA